MKALIITLLLATVAMSAHAAMLCQVMSNGQVFCTEAGGRPSSYR